jgi:hypothetical protein
MEATNSAFMFSGGFSVSRDQDEIVVARDWGAFDKPTRKRRRDILMWAAVASAVLVSGPLLQLMSEWVKGRVGWAHPISELVIPIVFVLAAGLPLGLASNALFPPSNSLRMSQERLIIQCRKKKTELDFKEIETVGFLDEGLSWLGYPKHIFVIARGRHFKCLQGIEPSEASKILRELQRFGYRVSGGWPTSDQ